MVSCDGFVALPGGAWGLSVVCDCGIKLVALLSLSSWCLVIRCVALSRGTRGLSAVCDYGIS